VTALSPIRRKWNSTEAVEFESEARRRAVDGLEEPVHYQGSSCTCPSLSTRIVSSFVVPTLSM
jgi:hypothetical protein